MSNVNLKITIFRTFQTIRSILCPIKYINECWVALMSQSVNPNYSRLHETKKNQGQPCKVPDLCALGSCSRFWRHLCASDVIWVSLSRERWPNMDFLSDSNCSPHGKEKGKTEESEREAAQAPEGWHAFYIKWHIEMAERAVSVVEFVRQNARHESLEVGDYQRAMELLRTMKLGFKDVQLYLFTRKHSVVLNLIALHYSLTLLEVQREYLKEALAMSQISDRHVCLRWWSLGHWVNGFRRGDEVHVHITSLVELLKLERQELLHVIQRGTVHEVLRIQISADFRTSAWIDRDMHSQR